METYYDGLGGGWGWRGWGAGGMGMSWTTQENTPEGTLVVDIFDGRTKHLIWRGEDTASLSGKPDKNIDKLAKRVDDMFKKFPPAAKG